MFLRGTYEGERIDNTTGGGDGLAAADRRDPPEAGHGLLARPPRHTLPTLERSDATNCSASPHASKRSASPAPWHRHGPEQEARPPFAGERENALFAQSMRFGELPDAEGPPAFCGERENAPVRTEHALPGIAGRTGERTHPLPGRPGPRHRQRARRTAGSPGGRPGQGAPGLTVHATQPRQPVPTALSRHEAPGGQPEKSTPTDSPCHAAPGGRTRPKGGASRKRDAMPPPGNASRHDAAKRPRPGILCDGLRGAACIRCGYRTHAPPPAAPRRSAAPCHTRGGRRAAGCDRA